jgi:mono/diheme cytochrome c family protein
MMWKCKKTVSSEQLAVSSKNAHRGVKGHRVRSAFVLLLTAHCLLLTAACRRDMQDQPKMKPFRTSTFFRDGLSTRPPIEGTVARGFLREDTEFFTGKRAGRKTANPEIAPAQSPAEPQPAANGATVTGAGSAPGTAAYPDDIDEFPITVTRDLVVRGKERYEIYCSACHGLTGNGDGMIVRRGFRRAASFNDDRLRQAPVGHYFDAITNGWGAMPSYAPQITPQDRWAIIAYIRALQLSQQNQTPNAQQTTPAANATPQSGGHQ